MQNWPLVSMEGPEGWSEGPLSMSPGRQNNQRSPTRESLGRSEGLLGKSERPLARPKGSLGRSEGPLNMTDELLVKLEGPLGRSEGP